ncbi:MAG TPA: PDZ domain-containing protein [Steroidobacteraceae bacterium]|nr:PDZ domain-containing protein [Steroidobacteraceae bacterium]
MIVALAAGVPATAAAAEAGPGTGKGMLGVAVADPPAPWRGALIARVSAAGAAERAGLRPQDLVVEADAQPISSPSDLSHYVASHPAGDRIALTVMRWNGSSFERLRITATLAAPAGEGDRVAAVAAPKAPAAPQPAAAPAPAAQGLNDVSWTSFTDPYENAFTIGVPRGWKVAGGVVRKNPLSPTLVLRVLAPDRRTLIAIGDPDSVPYNQPIAARDYVRRFAERAMSGACLGLSITQVKDLPDVERFASSKSLGPYNQWSAAQANFTCKGERQAGMAGEAVAVLEFMTSLRSGHAQILAAFVTAAGQEDAADQLLNHMVASLQQNPEWTARQQQLAQQLANGAMARWHGEQLQFQHFDDAITNTGHFVAPDGRRYDLDARPRYQWMTPDGHTVGTDTPSPPSPGSTLLQRSQE